MVKTGKGLAEYAAAQLGNPYWYGTFGQTAGAELLAEKTKQYSKHYTSARMSQYKSQFGKRVYDCVGLIKGYLWSDSASSKPAYAISQDVSANGMLAACREKGGIDTLPDEEGVLVFRDGHVGVYIGSGYLIEAKGFSYGVVKTALKKQSWVHWGKCPWVTYESNKYFPAYPGPSKSIVDSLAFLGVENSFAFRKSIAAANGITGFSGTPQQNTEMLRRLKAGKLIRP